MFKFLANALIMNEEGKFLVLERSGKYQGQLELPGGKSKDSERSIKNTLNREVSEETGLEIILTKRNYRFLSLMCHQDNFFRDEDVFLRNIYFGYADDSNVNISKEHVNSYWMSLDEMIKKEKEFATGHDFFFLK